MPGYPEISPVLKAQLKGFGEGAWEGWTNPLIPRSAIDPLQDSLTQPRLTRTIPEAEIAGFGAGALEGLRNISSPRNLVNMGLAFAVPGYGVTGRATQAAPQALLGLQRAAGTLGQGQNVQQGLRGAAQLPEFAPAGGEALYNATFGALPRAAQRIPTWRGGDAYREAIAKLPQ